jgi:hypothetical protein
MTDTYLDRLFLATHRSARTAGSARARPVAKPAAPDGSTRADDRSLDLRIPPGQWRETVRSRARKLRADAEALKRERRTSPTGPDPLDSEVLVPVNRADDLAAHDSVTPLEWWSGSEVEECWRLLRQAEEGLLGLAGGAALVQRARSALAHAEHSPGVDAVLTASLRTELEKQKPDETALRRAALDVVRTSHDLSDAQHQRVRSYRNQLMGVSAVLVLLAGALLLGLHLTSPDGVVGHLVPVPESFRLGTAPTVALVMFFGALGALFSAVPSLAQAPESNSPFNLPRQQALLKVLAGAWSAVLGLLFVQAQLLADNPAVASLGSLVALAVVFGAGQEAVTRFADHKASALLKTD